MGFGCVLVARIEDGCVEMGPSTGNVRADWQKRIAFSLLSADLLVPFYSMGSKAARGKGGVGNSKITARKPRDRGRVENWQSQRERDQIKTTL